MNDFLALDLSAAGMNVQRRRMQVVAENLANQHTTGPNGPYQRKQVVVSAVEKPFQDALDEAMGARVDGTVHSVEVSEVRPDGSEPVMVFDPHHPHANAEGYVAKPNIQPIREMTDMIEATRSYEANMAVGKASKEMIDSALELLRI